MDRVGEGIRAEQSSPEEVLDLVAIHGLRLVAREARQLRVPVPADDRVQVARYMKAQDDSATGDVRWVPVVASQLGGHGMAMLYHRGRGLTEERRMRRWSETAERVAATGRTSEKVAILGAYLRSLSPAELPIAVTYLSGRPVYEREERTTGLGLSGI